MTDEVLTIQQVENSDNFKYLFEFAKKKDYLKKINKYSVPTLTINKLKNLIISSIEQNKNNTKLISKPYRIIIDPTNACNLGCPLCPTGLGASERKKGILKLEDFKNVVDQVKDYCIEIHLYNWGEPTLNKHLVDMLIYATSRNLWSRISTNLSLDYKENFLEDLVRSGLSLLHVDIDGLDQEVYEKYRRKGNLKTVIKNLTKIKELNCSSNEKNWY
jgi:MoaA/NifB/PqqE/SkfB family radical SAM enzyme